jgi:PAS domain S-box-containing protein
VKRPWRPATVIVLLVVALTVLFLRSRTPDLRLRDTMQQVLRQVSLHDAELSRDVLLARAGLLRHYDPLAEDRRHLRDDIDSLHTAVRAATPEARAALEPGIDDLATAAESKLAATEDLKSVNAILRNSLAYLTHEAPMLQFVMRDPVRSAAFGRLSYAILRYLQSPEPGVGTEIQIILDQLAGPHGAEPELQTLLSHGHLVERMLPEVDMLGAEIAAAPTRERADALQKAVTAYADRVEARTQGYLLALYAGSLVLLAYLVAQFLRLRARAAEILRTNAGLKASEERYRAITDTAQEAIVSVDGRGAIRSWNRGAVLMFGYPAEDVLGLQWTTLVPERHRAAHAAALDRLFAAATPGEMAAPRSFPGLGRNGREFPLDVSLARWSAPEGPVITAIMRDMTEREKLQEAARRAELALIETGRMTSLGMLSLGVAHELSRPVQSLLHDARYVADGWQDASRVLDRLGPALDDTLIGGIPYTKARGELRQASTHLVETADDLRRFVRELNEFGRPSALTGGADAFDIREATARAVRLLDYLARERTDHFEQRLATDLPLARGNLPQFQQVAVNLIANALEALPDRARGVRVTVARAEDLPALALIVDDDGIGIAAERLPNLGQHFDSTKAATGGTGLGLAITRRIVESFGGTLRFESIPGKGTRATVIVPEAGPGAAGRTGGTRLGVSHAE